MDAAADATDADQTAMANVVTRFDPATPAPMIDVISLRPNSSVADMVQTDSTGHAMIHIYPGGSVTAVFRHTSTTDMGADLATVTGVQPNDTLTLEPQRLLVPPTSGAVVGSMTASWPAVGGASYYYLFTPCNQWYAGASTALTFTEWAGCHKNPMTLGYIAYNSVGTVIAFQTQTSVNFAGGGSTGISTWAGPQNVTLNAPALPSEIGGYWAYVYQALNGTYGYGLSAYNGTPTTPLNHVYTMPNGERMIGEVQMWRQGIGKYQTVWDTIGTSSWSLAAPTLMPWMTALAFSVGDHSVVWFADGTTSYDGIGASVAYVRQIPGPPAMQNLYVWNIAIPPGSSHFQLPQLPAPFSDLLPTLDDQPITGGPYATSARLIDFGNLTGYDAFRQLPSSSFACPECRMFDGTFTHLMTSQ
jgi:hypothetical protein